MFVIVQGLLSDDYVTQGYGTAVVPPPPPPGPTTVARGLSESSGAGGYLVPTQFARQDPNYPRTGSPWQTSGWTDEADRMSGIIRATRMAVVLAMAAELLDDEELL